MKKCLLAFVLFCISAAAYSETRVLLLDGDPSPDGSGPIDFALSHPVSIKGNYVAVGTLVGESPSQTDVLLMTSCGADWQVVAVEGEALPNTNLLSRFRNDGGLAPNGFGALAFPASSTLASNPNAARSDLVIGGETGVEGLIAGAGDPAPDGNGQFGINTSLAPAINASAQVAFSGSLSNTTGGSGDDEGIFRWDGATGSMIEIARKGGSSPNGIGTYTGTAFQSAERFASPFISEDGRVAFYAEINNGTSGSDNGFFVGNGLVTQTFFRRGYSLPGNEEFGNGSGYDFNENGDLAAVVNWSGTSTSLEGVYRSDGATIVQIAASGQLAPSGFPFRTFSTAVKQDSQGKSVFEASITADTGILDGIYSGDGTTITQLALEGTASPEGRGAFTGMGRLTISPGGFVAFEATTETATAIYRHKDGAIQEIVSTADSIGGSQIELLSLAGLDFGQADGINDRGEVAFAFELADGRDGVALGGVASDSVLFTDSDGDSVVDACDNCTLLANSDQRDTNGDGFGNICDPDLNNDGVVNFIDISAWVPLFNSACGDVDGDMNGDGGCNFGDYAVFPGFFGQPPGPSGLAP